MPPHPDAIADCVLQAFRALPLKCKPRQLANGRREWVPLAGIVLSREGRYVLLLVCHLHPQLCRFQYWECKTSLRRWKRN
ncbi:hypothetical protein EJ03DRAFT_263785 [Teratosphaeria nubilosa]|uniref:Uncharacterized protein n=1 Tax=Teratosphaeria nubilosa TaxID=161662 RepID=A0A6G1LMA0_9PEZI|nr:hypothetical protein EJ03DRAFT_263785 [Teratosphaeria nubilosa]